MVTLEERFWAKVRKGEGCWEWKGARQRYQGAPRYGWMRIGGRLRFAHRISWEIANGPIPAGIHVLHHCDNPPCVRPSHLFLGTNADNMADMVAKGRQQFRAARGEQHPRARVSEADVRIIRNRYAAGETQAVLAREFGLAEMTVSYLVRRLTWRHVA